jgi:hypothetical protein
MKLITHNQIAGDGLMCIHQTKASATSRESRDKHNQHKIETNLDGFRLGCFRNVSRFQRVVHQHSLRARDMRTQDSTTQETQKTKQNINKQTNLAPLERVLDGRECDVLMEESENDDSSANWIEN